MLMNSIAQHDSSHILHKSFATFHPNTRESDFIHSSNSSGPMWNLPSINEEDAKILYPLPQSTPPSASQISKSASKSTASDDDLILEELGPEEYENCASRLTIRPYEYEDAISECSSIKSNTPSHSFLSEVNTEIPESSGFRVTGSSSHNLGLQKKDGSVDSEPQRRTKCGRKRSLSMTSGPNIDSNILSLVKLDRNEPNEPVRRVRRRIN